MGEDAAEQFAAGRVAGGRSPGSPESVAAKAVSREPSISPPSASSGPWQARHRFASSGCTSRAKSTAGVFAVSTASAAGAAGGEEQGERHEYGSAHTDTIRGPTAPHNAAPAATH